MNNINVSGPQQPASIYKTKVLKGQVPFATQVTEPNIKYVIKHDFVLDGDVTIPENCILEFDGGSIRDGEINYNGCNIISNTDKQIFYNITHVGTIYSSDIKATHFGAINDMHIVNEPWSYDSSVTIGVYYGTNNDDAFSAIAQFLPHLCGTFEFNGSFFTTPKYIILIEGAHNLVLRGGVLKATIKALDCEDIGFEYIKFVGKHDVHDFYIIGDKEATEEETINLGMEGTGIVLSSTSVGRPSKRAHITNCDFYMRSGGIGSGAHSNPDEWQADDIFIDNCFFSHIYWQAIGIHYKNVAVTNCIVHYCAQAFDFSTGCRFIKVANCSGDKVCSPFKFQTYFESEYVRNEMFAMTNCHFIVDTPCETKVGPYIYLGGKGTCNMSNCIFEYRNLRYSPEDYIISCNSDGTAEVIIDSCSFTVTDNSEYVSKIKGFISGATAIGYDCKINNCSINLICSGSDLKIFNITGNIYIENNNIKITKKGDLSGYLLYTPVRDKGIIFKNNKINLPINIFNSVYIPKFVIFTDNVFINTSQELITIDRIGITTERAIFKNNYFYNIRFQYISIDSPEFEFSENTLIFKSLSIMGRLMRFVDGSANAIISKNIICFISCDFADDGQYGNVAVYRNNTQNTNIIFIDNIISAQNTVSGTPKFSDGSYLSAPPLTSRGNKFINFEYIGDGNGNVGTTNYLTNNTGIKEVGEQKFNKTLGKPVWWNGTAWVDATGATV